jgi:hypothetical protein
MDEKTAALRDIFIDATGSDTVTERQQEGRGSITGSEAVTDDQLAARVEAMRDRFDFESTLPTEALVTLLRGFFAGRSDADIAADLNISRAEVFAARMDLHLVTDADHTPVDGTVRPLVVDGAGVADCLSAVDLDTDPDVDADVVRRAYRVAESELAAARANYRFRDEFADLLTDEDLSSRLASDARRDGLQDATEDLETDVSL